MEGLEIRDGNGSDRHDAEVVQVDLLLEVLGWVVGIFQICVPLQVWIAEQDTEVLVAASVLVVDDILESPCYLIVGVVCRTAERGMVMVCHLSPVVKALCLACLAVEPWHPSISLVQVILAILGAGRTISVVGKVVLEGNLNLTSCYPMALGNIHQTVMLQNQ